MKCHYYPKTTDLRPYGPNSAMVCFKCAMISPERATVAENNFALQLRAIDGPALIDGTNAGVYPLKHNPLAVHAAQPAFNNPVTPDEQTKLKVALTKVFGWEKL